MPNPTLIIGGPGSGKTMAVISRLTAMYEADRFSEVAVLTPTLRHGDQFRRRLVASCGVALRLQVSTIGQYSRHLTSDVSIPAAAVAEELLARTIRREIDGGQAAYFQPIAGTRGLVGLLGASIRDLLAEGIAPQAFAEAASRAGSQSLAALAAIYLAYRSELGRREWVHPSQVAESAAEAVAAGAGLPLAVVVDGFQLFRGTELNLLKALAERCEVLITFDPGAGERSRHDFGRLQELFPNANVEHLQSASTAVPSVDTGSAADREGQMRAIARQIKQRLTDNPALRPSDFAVTFRRISPHLSLARQVFAEYDLPLDPAAGERLNSRPLGAWLRRLLHISLDGWRLRDVVGVLSSGFVDLARWQMTSEDVARFARWARKNHLWAGQEALDRASEGLKAEAEKSETSDQAREGLHRAAAGMKAAIEELRSLLEQPPDTPAEHARRLEESLLGDRPLISPDSRSSYGVDSELESLRGYLREIVTVHETLGGEPETFDSFLPRLEGKLDSPAVLLGEAGGVLLAPMHTLHGLRFDFVAVGGLIEGEFPAPRTSTALLDGSAIDALNRAGLELPPEPRLSEDELWNSVSSRAEGKLALWKTRLDDRGRPAASSYYLGRVAPDNEFEARAPEPMTTASRRELAIACARQWPDSGVLRPREYSSWPAVRKAFAVEQRRRSFGDANEYEGVLPKDLVTRLTGANAVWSASRLESYRTCAFQFFSRYALRLQEMDEEMEGADAATRGTVVHDILQDALEPLIQQGRALTSQTLEEALSRLRANSAEQWNNAPAKYGFGRAALWRLEAGQTLRQIDLLLRSEAELSEQFGVTRILGAEKEILATLDLTPPMRVFAGIDRLDEGSNVVVIVDYKSGREISRADVERGRRLQLQLYGYLGRKETGAERIIARYAWLDPATKQWHIDSSKEDDSAILENVVEVAGEVRSAVESGDFRVFPQVPTCPTYCSFKHICRVNEFSRWKWD